MKKDGIDRLWLLALSECNEVQRRRLSGIRALEIGWGGVSEVCKLTGMSHHTVLKGVREIKNKRRGPITRLRKEGGGRKKIIEKNPEIKKKIENILEDNTAGNPMSSLKWSYKSTYKIANEINSSEDKISKNTISSIMKNMGYTLQANKKSLEGKSVKERDEQFKYINEQANKFLRKKQPIISVDTKKKELIGNFKNSGRKWMKKGQPEEVNVHDFPSLGKGKAVPYGAYDVALNKGFVNVGISSDTAEFAVESIRQWWKQLGKKHYPKTKELLITADCGGSNGYRNRSWKYFLQKFANETKLKITVLHFPPATSKWNKIEHKLFSFISMNWRGKPLISYEVIINLIASTKTKTGLKVYARLDKNKYEKGIKISDKEFQKIKIKHHKLHPQWNYDINF